MVHLRSLLCSVSLVAAAVQADSCKNAPKHILYPQKASIPNSQNLTSSFFIGSPAKANPLKPLYKFHPDASLMHTDGGNSGGRDDPGPLGTRPHISSVANSVNMMLWGDDGSMTCGYANATADGSLSIGIVALDPSTFQILAAWYPPGNETLNLAYFEYIKKTNDIVLSTKEGHIYVLHRDTCKGNPYFTTIRTISLSHALQPGQQLLNSMYDTAGNIWFTSGGVINGGDTPQDSLTFGYISPRGKIFKKYTPDEQVENGIAVDGRNVYMVSGPTARTNKTNSIGYMYSMTSNRRGGIKINWRVPYTGKSGLQTGSVPRGAGSSPALSADKYVAITDRSSGQINLNIYHQKAQQKCEKQLLCQIPLFTPGKSDNDNAVIAHSEGNTHGFMIQNGYNVPKLYKQEPGVPFDLNGDWNDMSKMEGGMTRIDVDENGNCSLRWNKPHLAVKAVSILATKVGLIYSYVQDTKRSPKGEYIWYVAAIDWNTGKTVYQVRAGTGGTFNDNFFPGTVGPDGRFYQTVHGGILALEDGK